MPTTYAHPTAVTALTDFVRQRTADDEAAALDVAEHQERVYLPVAMSRDRVLAHCAAARRIVEAAEDAHRAYCEDPTPVGEARRFAAMSAVAELAAIYAGHPAYSSAFRP